MDQAKFIVFSEDAIKKGQTNLAIRYFENCLSLSPEYALDSLTHLFNRSAEHGRDDMINYILSNHGLNTIADNGATALCLAAQHEYDDLAEKLFDLGVRCERLKENPSYSEGYLKYLQIKYRHIKAQDQKQANIQKTRDLIKSSPPAPRVRRRPKI